jgi:hypothetical protein
MKLLIKAILILLLIISPITTNTSTFAEDSSINNNLKTGNVSKSNSAVKKNSALQNLKNTKTDYIITT